MNKNEATAMRKNISNLQAFLSILFVSSLLISNVITAKQIQLPLGITTTSAIIIFPITYILSDLFSEVYGYKWSRQTCYFAFLMNVLMVIVFELVILTPSPSYWHNQEAFAAVLGSTPRVLTASLVAFVAGDFVNDKVFRKMKARHNDIQGFELRARTSSFVGGVVDSGLFIPIAFIGTMPFENMITMGITQVAFKIGYEILILPLTKLIVNKTLKYEKD